MWARAVICRLASLGRDVVAMVRNDQAASEIHVPEMEAEVLPSETISLWRAHKAFPGTKPVLRVVSRFEFSERARPL
jgi:hypothetical protein